MSNYVFDIETGPESTKNVNDFIPEFAAPGNIKDPVKIAEAIARKEQDWKEDLALSALTGKVLIIGIKNIETGEITHIEGTEKAILTEFWLFLGTEQPASQFIGHYIHAFDLPFIIRRSWHHDIDVPKKFLNNRYWGDDGIIDTVKVWGLGGRQPEDTYVSLDFLAKHLKVGSKSASGKDFHKLYASDRPAALKYLNDDLNLTAGCACKLLGLQGEDKTGLV